MVQLQHHITIKLLLGIAPQGVISFNSESWGEHISDKYLTEHCGILKKLLPRDVVLGDSGFDIDQLQQCKLLLIHPPSPTEKVYCLQRIILSTKSVSIPFSIDRKCIGKVLCIMEISDGQHQ